MVRREMRTQRGDGLDATQGAALKMKGKFYVNNGFEVKRAPAQDNDTCDEILKCLIVASIAASRAVERGGTISRLDAFSSAAAAAFLAIANCFWCSIWSV